MSNLGKWDGWYKDLDPRAASAFRYGDTVTYALAASFMARVREVEDWGCGAGGFKRFCAGKYIGIDGSRTPFADKVVDLCNYESGVDGIVIRHVLEHDYRWEKILEGAVRSFKKRLCLVLFTPFSEWTREVAHNRQHGVDAPDISFCRSDIEGKFRGLGWRLFANVPTATGYGIEHVYFVWKGAGDESEPSEDELRALRGCLPVGWPHGGCEDRAAPDESRAAVRCTGEAGRKRVSRRVVYTAIFGAYDTLKDVPVMEGIDRICYTDDPSLRHPKWDVRRVEPMYAHPRLSAKYYKALPHVVLSEYDESLWIDGSFQVTDANFALEAFGHLQEARIALFRHPERDCIYDEADLSQHMAKYRDQRIANQVTHYREHGFPAKRGLFAGGIVARRNDDERVRRFNEAWMEENEKWTYQDQLSMPYLFWKLGIEPAVFSRNLWSSGWGVWTPHAHDR